MALFCGEGGEGRGGRGKRGDRHKREEKKRRRNDWTFVCLAARTSAAFVRCMHSSTEMCDFTVLSHISFKPFPTRLLTPPRRLCFGVVGRITQKNYTTHLHQTWREYGSQPRTDPVNFWGGSGLKV